ncbi:MlaA family lipoprotein [Salidesulfovibrio brasiliensis]|uniref:MlaA family lipoprotein n=1 Tax=Salidesulfovibrio brasiliensis TaxID=221711 RepID=UPI0006D0A425|nr:VacJ family lipoprotein [Salidesulfovibrio brasiliensis]
MRLTLALLIALIAFAAVPAFAEDGSSATQQFAQYKFDDNVWDDSGNIIVDDDGDQQKAGEPKHELASDPFEGWNRFWFQFNDKLYFALFKPIAQGYGYVLPQKLRQNFSNFFHNLLFPVRFVNCLLQFKFQAAGLNLSKFVVNSTFGLGGLADVTEGRKKTRPEIPDGIEDFGQTLGHWGMGNGPYLVWPLLGPSSARDTVGFVGDYFVSVDTYVLSFWEAVGYYAFGRINYLSLNLGQYETLKNGAIDPYQAFKDAYLRMRAKAVKE